MLRIGWDIIPTALCTDSFTSSWPGLSRPSTSLNLFMFEDVDARHKAGHDGECQRPLVLRRTAGRLRSSACFGRSAHSKSALSAPERFRHTAQERAFLGEDEARFFGE